MLSLGNDSWYQYNLKYFIGIVHSKVDRMVNNTFVGQYGRGLWCQTSARPYNCVGHVTTFESVQVVLHYVTVAVIMSISSLLWACSFIPSESSEFGRL